MTNSITMTVNVSNDLLSNILTTAVEGGTTYWAYILKVERDADHNVQWADFIDAETDEFQGRVTLSSVANGIERLLRPDFKVSGNIVKAVERAVCEDDAGEIDAEAADCIIQAALFDEIVYG